jgi:hypothetical protein
VPKPDVTANSPVAGSVAWGAFTIQYEGVGYAFPAGNTSKRWVWWKYNQGGVTTALQTGDDLPDTLTENDVVILANKNGVPVRLLSATLIEGELLVDGSIIATALATDSVTTRAIAANAVTAAEVGADVMVANNVYAREGIQVQAPGGLGGIRLDENGFLQLDAAGKRRNSFPADPALPNVMDADLTARGLTVLGRMSVRGTTNEISKSSSVTLAVATTKPASSPSVTNSIDDPYPGNNGATTSPAGASGAFWDGTNWYQMTRSGATIRLVKTTPAGIQTEQGLPFPAGASAYDGDIVKIGGFWYAIADNGGGYRQIFKFDATTLAYVSTWTFDNTGTSDRKDHYRIATDGTTLFHLQSIISSGSYVVSTVNLSTGARTVVATLALTGASIAIRDAQVTSFRVGNFDFGARRYIITWGGYSYVFTDAGVYDHRFPSVTQGPYLGWDGTRFWLLGTGGAIFKLSTLKADRAVDIAIAWRDSKAGGTGIHETDVGPRLRIMQGARTGLAFTCPPPADQGGLDDPDSVAIYGAVADGPLKLIGYATPAYLFVLDIDLTTGVSPLAVSNFPDSAATSARVQSASGGTYMSGDGLLVAGVDPTMPTDVVNFRTLNTQRDVARNRANHYGVPTADWSNGDFRIRNLLDPAAPTDAANQRYVDASSETYKASVTASSDATTGTNTVAGASITVATPSTGAVYLVEFFADLRLNAQTISAAVNLMIDGQPSGGQMALGGPSGLIIPAAKGWLVTGLAVGNHTFTIRHTNYAGQGSSTITTNSDLIVQRKR